jgi:hypothetical protein
VAASGATVEIWQGELESESIQKEKRTGKMLDLTLKINERKGTKFTGEWIEAGRSLEVARTITGRKVTLYAVKVLRGEWNAGVVRTITAVGKIEGDKMKGNFAGAGAKVARRGEFTLKKK